MGFIRSEEKGLSCSDTPHNR